LPKNVWAITWKLDASGDAAVESNSVAAANA
jgi:hypothetical protein